MFESQITAIAEASTQAQSGFITMEMAEERNVRTITADALAVKSLRTRDRYELQQIVKAGKQLLEARTVAHDNTKLGKFCQHEYKMVESASAETVAQYERDAARFLDPSECAAGAEVWVTSLKRRDDKPVSRATWGRRKTAILHVCRERLHHAAFGDDDESHGPDRERGQDHWQKNWRAAEKASDSAGYEEAFEQYVRSVHRVGYYASVIAALEQVQLPETGLRRASKKKRVSHRGLPGKWRESMHDYLFYCGLQRQLSFLAAALCGARPKELETGIVFEIWEGYLCAHLCGAKVKNHAGQPERELRWKLNDDPAKNPKLVNAMVAEVRAEISEGRGPKLRVDLHGLSRSGFSKMVTRAHDYIWPWHRHARVSAYTLREQFSTDLQDAVLLSPEQRSAAMSHASTSMISHYGAPSRRGASSGWMAPDVVVATVKVRKNASKEKFVAAKKQARIDSGGGNGSGSGITPESKSPITQIKMPVTEGSVLEARLAERPTPVNQSE